MLYGIGHLLKLLPGLEHPVSLDVIRPEHIAVQTLVTPVNKNRSLAKNRSLVVHSVAHSVQVDLFGSRMNIESVPYNCGAVHFPGIVSIIVNPSNWFAYERVEEILGQYGGYSMAVISLASADLNSNGDLGLYYARKEFVATFGYEPMGKPVMNKRSDNFIQWYQKKLSNDDYYLDNDDRRYLESDMSDSISYDHCNIIDSLHN